MVERKIIIQQLQELENKETKKLVQGNINEMLDKQRCFSLNQEYTGAEIQREQHYYPKGSSPLKSRDNMVKANTFTLQKLSTDFVCELYEPTAIQQPNTLQQLRQGQSDENKVDFMENKSKVIETNRQIIRKNEDFVSFSDNQFISNNPIIEENSNIDLSNRENETQTVCIENQKPQYSNLAQLQYKEIINTSSSKEDINDSSQKEEEIIVLSHVRRSNKLKSILKNPSPTRSRPIFQENSNDLQLTSQISSSVISDIQSCDFDKSTQELHQQLLVPSFEQNVQPIISNINIIESKNEVKIGNQSTIDGYLSRDHLRVGQDNCIQNQRLKDSSAVRRSQSLTGMKKVHFTTVHQQPRPVPCEHPIIGEDVFKSSAEILANNQKFNQKCSFHQTQQHNQSPQIHQGYYYQSSTFRNHNSLSPTIKNIKASPFNSHNLLNLSPLKSSKMPLPTKDQVFQTTLKLLPADTQIPQANLKLTSEPKLDLQQSAQDSLCDQNIPSFGVSKKNESKFLNQIQQNSAMKKDMKIQYNYDNSNYLTYGQYSSPYHKADTLLSHFNHSKETDKLSNTNDSIYQLEQTIQTNQQCQQELKGAMVPHNRQLFQSTQSNQLSESKFQLDRKVELSNKHIRFNNQQNQEDNTQQLQQELENLRNGYQNKQFLKENGMNFSFAENQNQGKQKYPLKNEIGYDDLDSQINSAKGISQSPLLEIFKGQIISKRDSVYYKRQNTNPVDSEGVNEVKDIEDKIIRSNSVK